MSWSEWRRNDRKLRRGWQVRLGSRVFRVRKVSSFGAYLEPVSKQERQVPDGAGGVRTFRALGRPTTICATSEVEYRRRLRKGESRRASSPETTSTRPALERRPGR